MGALGQYLRSAREARGIDLHDAAQQTRIGINYLKALENEDFSRLPGAVFVRGFLKNYGKFLRLDEAEVMKKYAELTPPQPSPVSALDKKPATTVIAQKEEQGSPIEPFIWGAAIMIVLAIFLFIALPQRHQRHDAHVATTSTVTPPPLESVPIPAPKSDKLYLEITALDNTWLLVRTDNSPQKKAVLKKGESLIWSADERFLLSYGSAGAVKLQLNGRELSVDEPRNAVIRDLSIIASGIVSKKAQSEDMKPKRPKKPLAAPLQTEPSAPAPTAHPQAAPGSAQQVQQPPAPAVPSQSAPASSPQVQQAPAPAPSVPSEAPTQAPAQPTPAQ